MVPATGSTRPPNPDLPVSIKRDINEARAIASLSPRGAAALLRLAVEKLCIELNEGQTLRLDQHIALLVARGLNEETAHMFDVLRLVGNNAVHPLDRLQAGDNAEMVETLFWLVNEIADEVITKPMRRADVAKWIPEEERARIAERNEIAKVRLQKQLAEELTEATTLCD